MRRLFRCTVQLIYEDEYGDANVSSLIADRTEFWWNERRPDKPMLWDSKIELGEKFFQEIIQHPIPLDMNTLKALKRCALGLDLYLWLTYRTFVLKRPLRLSWRQLYPPVRLEPGQGDWRQLEFPATTNRIPHFFRADPDHEGMVKDQQVRRLVKLQKNEKTLTIAARAGLSRKTARKYLKSGKLPSQSQPERYWRTRSDPFESVWPEVEEILKRSPTVEATAVFEYLCRQQEGVFQQGQLRTLQRRIKQCDLPPGTSPLSKLDLGPFEVHSMV